MKRFAVILIIAVLALGCVFAATNTKDAPNNGDKFVVTTTIKTIYPVYEIVGSDGQTTGETANSDKGEKIEGKLSDDGDHITITTTLNHFGMKDNDMNSTKTDIRYKGAITVTITASELINKTTGLTFSDASSVAANAEASNKHVYKSGLPTAGTFTNEKADNFTAACTNENNTVKVTATYTNGQKVPTSSDSVKIAAGSFDWNISKLTAGDYYEANVVVTYTIQ